MPAVIPLLGAGVGAAGSIISANMAAGAADKQAQVQAQQAEAARQAALANANQANNSAQSQATTAIQQQQQNFANALLTPGLVQNQAALTGQLQTAAAGGGPNPALAQLDQTTGQNIQNQAALMAGQRGAGSNAGLLARQAAMQGASTQQQSIGQAATLSAQQQIDARQQLQQALSGQMNLGLQAQQGAASTALGNQGITTGAINSASGMGNQAALQAMQSGQQGAMLNSEQQQKALGAGFNAAGAGLSAAGGKLGFAQGGEVSNLKENYSGSGPRSKIGQHIMGFAQGGSVRDMRGGGKVPGTPAVAGATDSYANDTIDAKLSPGEIVLPRSVTKSSDPVAAATKFVAAIKAKSGKK